MKRSCFSFFCRKFQFIFIPELFIFCHNTASVMKRVVILKSEGESTDSYNDILKENKFEPIFVPTLEFRYKDLDKLREKLQSPEKYAGLLFTSPRSVDAVTEALNGQKLHSQWEALHNYCVGEVTHNLVSSFLYIACKGKQSGNANNLADFIRDDMSETDDKRPFLFPCGNLRHDTMQLKLAGGGYSVDAVEVYETGAHSELEDNLKNALANDNVEYLAFFSPSGVTYCMQLLQKNDMNLNSKKLIAIGPSTRKCMETNELKVYKTAEKPSVEYLVKALIGA